MCIVPKKAAVVGMEFWGLGEPTETVCNRARPPPRGGTANEVAVRPNRNRVGQLALGGKITGNVLVDGRVMDEVGAAILGI